MNTEASPTNGAAEPQTLHVHPAAHEGVLLAAVLYEELAALAQAHAALMRRCVLLERELLKLNRSKAES